MAVARNEIQFDWGAGPSNSVSVAAGNNDTSNAKSFSTNNANPIAFQCKADNDGTPASGDTVDFWLLATLGDPDGSGSDEFLPSDSTHAIFLGQANTNTSDPAQVYAEVDGPIKQAQVYAVNNSGGRAITVSAIALERTVS